MIQLRELGPTPAVLPPGYDVNARCEVHLGAPNHSIENYKALKYKVQDLIDSKEITFACNGLNVNNNPMPPHKKSIVNMVEMYNGRRLLTFVDELKTPLIEIKNILMKNNAFPVGSTTCEDCLINPQQCKILRSTLQKLMDQGILLIDRPSIIEKVSILEILYDEILPIHIPYDLSQMNLSKNPITHMVITIPVSFPYNDTKIVLWVYDSAAHIRGQRMQEKPMMSDEPILSIVGTGQAPQSGRIFSPITPPVDNIGPSTQAKGKQIKNA